jgi:hypothetical protein
MTSELKEDFEQEAAWRAEKAAEYRRDPRNEPAVEILRHLAATADDVPPHRPGRTTISDTSSPSCSPKPISRGCGSW